MSAVLSGSKRVNVSEETRRTVLDTAERLGYVSRRPAPRRRKSGAQSALIVEGEPPAINTNEPWLDDAYQTLMGRILTASGRYLQEHGIGQSVHYLSYPQNLTQWLADSSTQGVLWHATDSDTGLLHWVASRYPLVLLNREWKATVPFDSVSIDQEKSLLLAAEYLRSLGHRRIAIFGHNEGFSVYRRRVKAYKEFVLEHGLRDFSEFQEISDALDRRALDKVADILDTWRKLGEDAPTALITSDVFALPLLSEARQAGIRIPDDLSVIGIDNTAPCSLVEPQLTSVNAPFDEMCRVAVELLLRRMANAEELPHSVQVVPRLIKRHSVKSLGDRPAPSLSLTTATNHHHTSL